ncbi:hypothetical protein [Rhodobacter sp. 24-YEA-8]|nr:hypothetical protein [Rhodobacter sp. 24-YEA-8]
MARRSAQKPRRAKSFPQIPRIPVYKAPLPFYQMHMTMKAKQLIHSLRR